MNTHLYKSKKKNNQLITKKNPYRNFMKGHWTQPLQFGLRNCQKLMRVEKSI